MPRRRRVVPESEWRDLRHRRGVAGERVAMRHLVSAGWQIVAHRFRAAGHEVDIIASRGNLTAFVEVKTRHTLSAGAPAEAIGWRKRRAIERVAEVWRLRHGAAGQCYRFDVVGIVMARGAAPLVEHIEDAWRIVR